MELHYTDCKGREVSSKMDKKTILGNISAYSLTHALVDATCAATLFAIAALGRHEPHHLFYMIVLYNVVAFATQPLFGLAVDTFDLPVAAAVAGTLLVAAATLLLSVPFLAALVAGVGNALFHVGGGVVSLKLASGKATLPGIYVAPGALGLMIGIGIGESGRFIAWPFVLLLLVSALLISRLPRPETEVERPLPGNLRWFERVIVLLLTTIAVRGVVGLSLVLPWKSDPVLLLALTGAVVLGKALGGILGDRFGWNRVALAGLVVAAPLLTFASHIPLLAIVGALFFNLTMPITLTCLARILPGKSGFAFGLTTLALIIGALPTFTQFRTVTSRQPFLLAVILASVGLLYAGLRLYTEHFEDSLS